MELVLDLEDLVFGMVQDHEEFRLEDGDLTAEFPADAAGAGHHDRTGFGKHPDLSECGSGSGPAGIGLGFLPGGGRSTRCGPRRFP